MTRRDDAAEVGGADPLDREMGHRPVPVTVPWFTPIFRSRVALGMGPITAPAVLFVPLGYLMGPSVAGILSQTAVAQLDPVVSVALAALGVFVGLALDLRTADARRLFVAASAEACITVATVAVFTSLLLWQWQLPLGVGATFVALVLGVSASASSATSAAAGPHPSLGVASRIADLDDVLPIAIGAGLVASLAATSFADGVRLLVLTAALGLTIAVAGWLLFERARSAAERVVFVGGALMLLGGAAAYLSLSPLMTGMVAGLFWTFSPGRADQVIREDVQKLQHPLVVLLLITAGASLVYSPLALWLFAPFTVFRLTGKLLGGRAAAALSGGLAPADLGAWLLPPGLLGIAFALNVEQVGASPAGGALLFAVVVGSIASEVIAVAVAPGRGRD